MQDMLNQLTEQLAPLFGAYIPHLVGAMAILLVGWLVALISAAMVRAGLRRMTLDRRLAEVAFPEEPARAADIRRWAGSIVFYLIMLFVLIAAFQTLQLTQIIEPLNRLLTEVFEFLPRLLSAVVLLGIAWGLASLLRLLITRGLRAAKVDERLGSQTDLAPADRISLIQSVADGIYWLTFLLFLPAVLGALALEGLLDPVKGMMNTLLGFLPNIFAAGLILMVGWFLAKIVQKIVVNLLTAAGTDRVSDQVGLTRMLGTSRLSQVIGLIVFVLILIPLLIASLNALELEAITQPASNMLNMLLGALPGIFGATLVLILAYVVGRVLATLLTNVLDGIGFNTVLVRLGLIQEVPAGPQSPAAVMGTLFLTAVMLFAAMEASKLLGFALLADLISRFMVFGGHLLLGLIVIAIGLYLANFASTAIQSSGAEGASLLAKAAKVAILVLVTAMALRQMGLADEIVNLAFGLLFGALAVAVALAFGLGGRDIAAKEIQEWVQSIKSKRSGTS